MKNIFSIFSLLLIVSFSYSQESVYPISSIDPNNVNFDDLSFLAKVLEENKILGLGEQSHLDGASNDARVRLIKYLHEELGYNVIVFESGLYDCTRANEFIQNKDVGDDRNYLFDAIFGLWHTKEVNELAKYIDNTQKTKNPLILSGMDIQFGGEISRKNLINDFAQFIKYVEKESNSIVVIDSTELANSLNQLRKYSNHKKGISIEDTTIISSAINKMNDIIDNAKLNTEKTNYWKQVMLSMNMDYRKRYTDNKSLRDSMMAVNVSWLANNKFKDEKIIIWGANSHLIKYGKSIDSEFNKKNTRTGEYLRKEFKDKYYFIALTAYEGKTKMVFKMKIPKPNKISIESYLYNQGYEYSFLNLRSFDDKENKYFKNSSIKGYYEVDMNVFEVMDGIFYVREMYPRVTKF